MRISDWSSDVCSSDLGCRTSSPDVDQLSLDETAARIRAALIDANAAIGPATGTLMLKVDAPIPSTTSTGRPLRASVVQSIMPAAQAFSAADLHIRPPPLRRPHRNPPSTPLPTAATILHHH